MMESVAVKESPVIGIIFASPDSEAEGSRHKRNKKDRTAQGKKPGNRVLILGRLRELALYRAEVLRQEGFNVSTADDVEEAIRMMQRSAFDAVVLSYTLPVDVALYLAEMARDYCIDCPIIAIANSGGVDKRIAADAVAIADEGPTGLVSALHQVLELG